MGDPRRRRLGAYDVGEHDSLEQLCGLAELIIEHGEVVTHVASYLGGLQYLAEIRDWMEDRYRGEWPSVEHYAEELASQMGDPIPSWLEPYIDYARLARDLEMGGDIVTSESGGGGVHIFAGH